MIDLAIEACLSRQVLLVNFSCQVSLWLEDGQAVVQSVELKEVLNELGHQSALLGLAKRLGFGVLEVEGAATLLNLVLIVDHLEDA